MLRLALRRSLNTQAAASASRLTYPVRPPAGMQNGRLVDTAMWSKIQTILPVNRWEKPAEILHDEEETHSIHVASARELEERPTLAAAGFELVDHDDGGRVAFRGGKFSS